MAHLGHPLLGDPAYGRGAHATLLRELGFARQALHAQTLGFTHPVSGAAMRFESAVPDDIQAVASRLRV
jgi:23S rRNA pseudouridine1911/1915/1917 synthase